MAQVVGEHAETIGHPSDPISTPTRSRGRSKGKRERVTVWYHEADADGLAPPGTSLVPAGMTIVGDCEGAGDVYVDGEVKGSVNVSGLAVIGRNGVVEGSIVARNAVVAGSVYGVVAVESYLELTGTAHVEADVKAGFIRMEDGASLTGAVKIGSDGAPRRPGDGLARDQRPDPPEHLSDVDAPAVEHVRLHFGVH